MLGCMANVPADVVPPLPVLADALRLALAVALGLAFPGGLALAIALPLDALALAADILQVSRLAADPAPGVLTWTST